MIPFLTPVIEYVFDTTISIGKLLMGDIFTRFFLRSRLFFQISAESSLMWLTDLTRPIKMLRGINFVKDLGGTPTQFLKNIYVDTGGDKTLANFLSALELLALGHIVWGSDWPAKKDIKSSIQAVESLTLSQNEIKKILGENLNDLLKGV